jgi:hypothetical protein
MLCGWHAAPNCILDAGCMVVQYGVYVQQVAARTGDCRVVCLQQHFKSCVGCVLAAYVSAMYSVSYCGYL